MALFLSKFVNKVDKKARVSLPSNFRNVILQEKSSVVVIYKSFINNAIEGTTLSRIEMLSQAIDNLDPYSEERDAFATVMD